jgi:DNA-binding Lrp family transcriptional regulator
MHQPRTQSPPSPTAGWHLLSNHALVLLSVARQPRARIRDIADAVGITDRACQRILNDLVDTGYVTRRRVGRRNEYGLDLTKPMPHPLVQIHQVSELVEVFGRPKR